MIEILSLPKDEEGIFLERINRFVGLVKVKNDIVKAHVHDTGRLGELLYQGNRVLLKKAYGKERKTQWDVIASMYDGEWILTNSSYHSKIFYETLLKVEDFKEKKFKIRKEVKFGSSRLDFLLLTEGKEILVEVKGCTLRKGDMALFPDAPTERGRKHVYELIERVKAGYEAWLVFLVMHSKAKCFSPNKEQDRAFAEMFYKALESGIKVFPLKYMYDGNTLWFLNSINMC